MDSECPQPVQCCCIAYSGKCFSPTNLCDHCGHDITQHFVLEATAAGGITELIEAHRCTAVTYMEADPRPPVLPQVQDAPNRGGGEWYQQGGIEPVDFILSNNLSGWKSAVIEYVFRAGVKGGRTQEVADIEKAIWWLKQRLAQIGT